MKASEILKLEEKKTGYHQTRLFEKVVIELFEIEEPISINELSARTDIQIEILKGILFNLRKTKNIELRHIMKGLKFQGSGYVLNDYGRKKVIDLEKHILKNYEYLKKEHKLKQIQRKKDEFTYKLLLFAMLAGGLFLGLGIHNWLISLF